MAVSLHTVTGNIRDVLRDPLPTIDAEIRVRPDIPAGALLIDLDNDVILAGARTVEVADDGAFTVANLTGSDSTGLNWLNVAWSFDVVFNDPVTRSRHTVTLGPYLVTGNTTLAALHDTQSELPPTVSTAYRAEIQGYVDQAQSAQQAAADLVTSDLGTTDGQTRALIQDPNSQTAAVLAASIVSTTADWLNVKIFDRTVGDGRDATDAFEAARDFARTFGRIVYVPHGDYKLTRSIDFTATRGLIGDGMHVTTITAANPAGTVCIYTTNPSGNLIFRDWSMVSDGGRAVQRDGFVAEHYSGHNVYANLRFFEFNGRGFDIEAIYDSVLSNIVVELCGNVTSWACRIDGGTDTSNQSIIHRLQVEQSVDKALYLDVAWSVLTDLHSERLTRTTTTSADVSHYIRGQLSTFQNLRIDDLSAASLLQVGLAGGSMSDVFCGALDLLTATTNRSVMSQINAASLHVGSSNVGFTTFRDSVLGATSVSYSSVEFDHTRFTGNITLDGTGSVSLVEGSFDTGKTVLTTGGATRVKARGTSFDQPPAAEGAKLWACEFRAATATFGMFGSESRVWDSEFAGTVSISSSANTVRLKACTVPGDLITGAGNPVGRAELCLLTKPSPTISAQWAVTYPAVV